MLIKRLNYASEFFLYLLIYAITFSNAFTEVCVGWIIGLFLIKRIIAKDASIPKSALNYIVLAYFLVILFSYLGSAFPKQSSRGFLKILKFSFLYLALLDFFRYDKKVFIRFFWAIIIVSAFTFLNGIFQGIFGFDILKHKELIHLDYLKRLSASFVHPNDFGAYIISLLPLTFAFFYSRLPRPRRIALIAVALLGSYCLMKTSSRSAWLGLLVGVIIYFMVYRKKAAVIVPSLFLFLIFIFPHGVSRVLSLFSREQNTVWERMQLWQGTWSMIKEHPFLGFGINTYSNYFPRFKPPEYFSLAYTHNCYLQMWSETGIIGLAVFLALIITVFVITGRNLKRKVKSGLEGYILLGLICGYLAYLVQAGFDTNLYSLVLVTLFWVMTAALVALNKFLQENPDA